MSTWEAERGSGEEENVLLNNNLSEEIKLNVRTGSIRNVKRDTVSHNQFYSSGRLDYQSVISFHAVSMSKAPQFLIAFTVNIGALICGMVLGWPSPVMPQLLSVTDPVLNKPMTPQDHSWAGSLICVGAALGPILAGLYVDRFGRKLFILGSTVPFVIGSFIITTTNNALQIYFSRLFMGIGIGIIFTVCPMYVGEIAEDSVRGALGSLLQLMLTVGYFIEFCVGPFVKFWLLNLINTIVPLVYFIIFVFCPESPYYLVQTGQLKEAEKAVKFLRGLSEDQDGIYKKEVLIMKENVEESSREKGTCIEIFKNKAYRKAVIISVGLVSFQQLSGINVVLMYAQSIFHEAGVSIKPEYCTMIIGALQIVASCVTPLLVDRLGRKILLILSASLMCLSLLGLGTFFFLKEQQYDMTKAGFVPLSSLIIYIIGFCLGFGPIPWAILGEIFPSTIKPLAAMITASYCWGIAFIMTKFFVDITRFIGMGGAFWLFSGLCLLGVFFVIFVVIETKGKSFGEIQHALGHRPAPEQQIETPATN